MKLNIRHAVVVALMVGLFAVPVAAQQYTISNTTLNGAINSTQTTLVLTSASASTGSSFGAPAAGQCLLIDGELMRIVSMSSTTATVTRASGSGSNSLQGPAPHPNSAVIWTAPCNAFKQGPPAIGSVGSGNSNNSCSTQPAPWIDVTTGNIFWCNTSNNKWTATNYLPITYNSVPTGQ